MKINVHTKYVILAFISGIIGGLGLALLILLLLNKIGN